MYLNSIPMISSLKMDSTLKQDMLRAANDGHRSCQEYEVEQFYHSEIIAPVRVVCVGSGISGLCLAYKMMERLSSFELTIFEKNEDIGGTWYENRYPGCACDIPAHLYTFSWEPKHDWSKYYADSAEIQRYCRDFYDGNNIQQFTKLSHRVKEAVWDEVYSEWKVEVEDLGTGRIFETKCDILINASGFLNKWTWPDIPGIESFSGTKLHSAAWDHAVVYNEKRIAVIGTGSSAIQIVPQMQKVAQTLKVFMRSPTWITTAIGGKTSNAFQANDCRADEPAHQQFTFTEAQKKQFKEDPEFHLQFRKKIEAEINWMADIFTMGTNMQVDVQKDMTEQMKKRLGAGLGEELASKLIPTWPPGCRRLTPGDGYLEALVQPNVTPIFSEIKQINETSIVMQDGSKHEIDILICATGFDVSFVPSFNIVGCNGVSMADAWKDMPDAYLALAAPGFPNYFVICGPQGPLGNGSILPAIEVLCDYFCSVIEKVQAERIKCLQPSRQAAIQFQEHMHKYHKKSVWTQPCRSWYKNGKIDGEPQLWCGTALSYIKTIRNPRFEDYDIEYRSPNRFAYLGNGKIRAHNLLQDGKPDIEGLAPYIRNADTPWNI